MGKRKIGIIYEYNENWIGGSYYIQNLISGLNHLPDEQKPILNIFTEKQDHFDQLATVTGYPFLVKRKYADNQATATRQFLIRVFRKLFKRDLISSHRVLQQVVFPASNEHLFSPKQTFLYWIPDFQEHYLPHFFTKEEITARKNYQVASIERARYLVLSSRAAQKDFNEIYPKAEVKQFVLPFAVSHAKLPEEDKQICARYGIPDDFYICSNQFWIHKNHQVLIKAIRILKDRGINIFVAFTGKEHDYRNPDYFESLKSMVADLGVGDQVKFLGFISREDQLILMKKAKAIIQTSLFEGWSTVVEDAKSLNAPIIASDIAVHKEQLAHYKPSYFFSPKDPITLVDSISSFYNQPAVPGFTYDYEADVKAFGKKFISIIEEILSSEVNR